MSKLIIAGKGIGWEEAPEDPALEIWGVNDYFLENPNCKMVWEMHDFTWSVEELIRHRVAVRGNSEKAGDTYLRAINQYAYFKKKAEIINKHEIPLMTSGGIYDENNLVHGMTIPTSMDYPLGAVLHQVCASRMYLVGTIAYMMAYALLLGKWDHWEVYGCNLEAGEEWAYQRPCTEWLCGKAEERGIKVDVIGSKTHLLHSPRDMLYGYINTYPDMRPTEKEPVKRHKLWYPLG